jgi:hypothetical protein
MLHLRSSRLAKCFGFLVLLPLALMAMPMKNVAPINCCELNTKGTTNYYSDASKTVWVGRYTWNDCTGTESLIGQQTQYATTTNACCSTC